MSTMIEPSERTSAARTKTSRRAFLKSAGGIGIVAAVLAVHLIRMKLAGRLADAEHVTTFLTDLKPVRHVLVGALLIQLGTFFLWWLSLRFGTMADRTALDLANAGYGTMFWGVGIGVGLLLPLALGAWAVWKGDVRVPGRQVWTVGVTSALILVGGVFFRLAVVLGGQVNPIFVTLQ